MNRSAALRCGSMETTSRRAGSQSGAPTRFMVAMCVQSWRSRLAMNRSAELPLGSAQALDRAELELGAPLRFSISCRWCLSRCDKPVRVERTECAPRPAIAPLYAALLVAARRVPPHGDAAPCNKDAPP